MPWNHPHFAQKSHLSVLYAVTPPPPSVRAVPEEEILGPNDGITPWGLGTRRQAVLPTPVTVQTPDTVGLQATCLVFPDPPVHLLQENSHAQPGPGWGLPGPNAKCQAQCLASAPRLL